MSRLARWSPVDRRSLAGLAANYWVLETLLADRTDPAGSWISDLGARTEATGLALRPARGRLRRAARRVRAAAPAAASPAAPASSRWGSWRLLAVGVCTIVDGAFPLSCAETLAEPCELRYDPST